MSHTVRIWDLPTRLFHWALALSIVALVVSAKLGGNAMVWHVRLGHGVLALLLFRLVWGLVGGHWSRFGAFLYSPARLLRYLRGQGLPEDAAGHNPLGALSVFALLGAVALQVGTGLFSDDEIAFSGPLTPFVSNDWVSLATGLHKDLGQYLVLGLVALHLLAVALYVLVKKNKGLVRAMVVGDKQLPVAVAPSRDDAAARGLALVVLALCSSVAWWVSGLG